MPTAVSTAPVTACHASSAAVATVCQRSTKNEPIAFPVSRIHPHTMPRVAFTVCQFFTISTVTATSPASTSTHGFAASAFHTPPNCLKRAIPFEIGLANAKKPRL